MKSLQRVAVAEKRDGEQKALRHFRMGVGPRGVVGTGAGTRSRGRDRQQGRGLAPT